MKLPLALPLLLQGAFGWGEVGHRTVAYLAYKYIQPSTRAYLDGLLAYNDERDVSDAAIWPDQIRYARPETKSWHYIDAHDSPPDECVLRYPADCSAQHGGCIVSAIAAQTAAFIDPLTSPTVRQEALKFVLHFIGDIHQPMHNENLARGGNDIKVCWHSACQHNLHAVWDTSIPHAICGVADSLSHAEERAAAQSWAKRLRADAAGPLLEAECTRVEHGPDECALGWAREANKFVCSHAMKHGVAWFEGRDLAGEYYEETKPVVEYLIGKAGVRLAAWLEAMVAAAQRVKQEEEWEIVSGHEEEVLAKEDL